MTYSVYKGDKMIVSGLTGNQIHEIFGISLKTLSNYVRMYLPYKGQWLFERDKVEVEPKRDQLMEDWDRVTRNILRDARNRKRAQ